MNPSSGSSPAPLYRSASRAAWFGLGVNLTLGIVKLVGGLLGSSFALISDAVNSLGDSLTSIVVIYGLWYAQRPADDEHPYGHTRAEAVAASNVAMLIFISAMFIGWEAISRLGSEHAVPPVWTMWIAAANIVIKESLFWYKLSISRRTGSLSIAASAWDHRSDALCSLAVLIGLAVVRWGGPDYMWADEGAALVVVGAILLNTGRIYRQATSELLDPQASDELIQQIRAAAEAVPGVRAVEKLWVRKTGLEFLADIHIEVDAQLTVDAGHRIGHQVKDKLIQQFVQLRDVLVHLEPYPHEHSGDA
ncbi:cation diffusion facilitator family transporter [Blastopirellula retiformator]|uniref:Putative cation efflux system protein n=1 Tax=Blastopirellula retiformator TaxID=2527970 RepID=A0A5C5V5N7_9BACT|nr:cation diffusion facilitator family transporter [Blastopirellula retiformator]TWT33062.1 putative cation efflux system protein [Blastopirellula retiformator]